MSNNNEFTYDFWEQLLDCWGREDICGPWTKNVEYKEGNSLKFYKEYFFVSHNFTDIDDMKKYLEDYVAKKKIK